MEKTELEQNVAHSNMIVDRMSKNVETLQWRIKNKFDFPVEKLTSQNFRSEHLILDDTSCSVSDVGALVQQSRYQQTFVRSQQVIICIFRPQNQEEEMPCQEQPAQRKKPTSLFLVSEEMMEATTSRSGEVSPSPDFTDSIEGENNHDNLETSIIDNQEELELDVDSLDEGVGDVSSDGEQQLSPVCDKSQTVKTSPALSPVKERIPSRFSFSNT